MSDKRKFTQADFGNLWFNVNDLNKKHWDEIWVIANRLVEHDIFLKDPFKCIVTAFVLYVAKYETLTSELSQPDDWLH